MTNIPGGITVLESGESNTFDARGFRAISLISGTDGGQAEGVFVVEALADGDTVTIGSTVYTVESGTLGTAYEVDFSANHETTLDNLIAAINGTGTPGTEYAAGTAAHPDVTAERGADVAAVGTLTGDTIAATNTVTIGSRVYTFEAVLTNVAGNVLVGVSDSESLDNLISAINLTAGAGTTYAAATTIHPTVSAAAGDGDTLVATAKVAGANGNLIATTDTLTVGAWAAVTLVDGSSSMAVTAIEGGEGENSIATEDTASGAEWDDSTLLGGLDATVLWSRVMGREATSHGDIGATITDDSTVINTLTVDWPYYHISVTGGSVNVALVTY